MFFSKDGRIHSSDQHSCRVRKAASRAGQHLGERQSSRGGAVALPVTGRNHFWVLAARTYKQVSLQCLGLGAGGRRGGGRDLPRQPSQHQSLVQKSDEWMPGGQYTVGYLLFILFWPLDSRVSGVSEPKTRLAVVSFPESCGSWSLLKAGRQERVWSH